MLRFDGQAKNMPPFVKAKIKQLPDWRTEPSNKN
jgi:hypothetical protein